MSCTVWCITAAALLLPAVSSWSAVKTFSSPFFVWPFWIAPVSVFAENVVGFLKIDLYHTRFLLSMYSFSAEMALFPYSGSDLVTLLPISPPLSTLQMSLP